MVFKKIQKETIIESIGIVFIFTIIQKLMGFIRNVIFARFLGPDKYAIFTLAIFFIQLVVDIGVLGIPSCYVRYVPQYEKKGMLNEFFKKVILLAIIIGIIIVLICIIFSSSIGKILYKEPNYKNIIILSSLAILPSIIIMHLISFFKGLRIFKISSLLESIQMMFFSIIGILLMIYSPLPQSAIIADLLSLILIVLIGYVFLNKYLLNSNQQNIKVRNDNLYKKIFSFSIWLLLMPIVLTTFNYTDRLLLNRYLGLREVGIYSAGENITQILFVVGLIIGNVLMPNMSELWEKNEKTKVIYNINLATKITAIILSCTSSIFLLLKKPIITLLFGDKYIEAIPLLSTFIIFWILNSVVWIIGMYPQLIEKTYLMLLTIIPGLIINIFLNIKLIPIYGIVGAVSATAISYVIIFIITIIVLNKEGLKIEKKTVILCLVPSISILGSLYLIIVMVVVVIAIVKYNIIFNKAEKINIIKYKNNIIKRYIKAY